MEYETKVILSLIAKNIGKASSVEEAYEIVVNAANVEGHLLLSYDEYQKELATMEKKSQK